jgi:hypothetical protein
MNHCANCFKKTSNAKFCCLSCSATYTNKTHPKRKPQSNNNAKCPNCKKNFHTDYATQICCSKQCSTEYRRLQSDKIIEQEGFGDGHYHNLRIRKYLIRKHGNNCMICGQSGDNWNGKPITLIVDHIDGKSNNNKLNNLRIVCPNCDCQLPTYKAKNKGNSSRKYFIVQK